MKLMIPAARRTLGVFDPEPADAIDHKPEDAKPCRTLPADIERMLGIDDMVEFLNCSRRCVERLRAAGKFPKPDIKIGRMPRWKPTTIRAWITRGGKP